MLILTATRWSKPTRTELVVLEYISYGGKGEALGKITKRIKKDFLVFLTNRNISNNKWQEFETKRSVWCKSSPVPFCSLTFLFLTCLSVCLHVSRVRAYLTTNQQHGISCLPKRGPLPDWTVWTRERMISGAAAEGEGSSVEREEGQPPQDERARALSPELSLRAHIDERAHALSPTISLRAPDDKRAQAL